jgi:predicted lipid-binding transport protein (Tim44 family)
LAAAWRRRRAAGASARDVDEFLRVARLSFVRLQAAWDAADLQALAALTTGPLAAELREELEARPPGPNRTEVLTLDARLLAMEELNGACIASVEFSGLIRERLDAGAAPFRELWMLARLNAAHAAGAAAVPGWRLARVQALA